MKIWTNNQCCRSLNVTNIYPHTDNCTDKCEDDCNGDYNLVYQGTAEEIKTDASLIIDRDIKN